MNATQTNLNRNETMTTNIQTLVDRLTEAGLEPKIWSTPDHSKLRVYIKPKLGKRMAKDGKVFFDYVEEIDRLEAWADYDESRSPTIGTVVRVWHPSYTVRTWAWDQMKETINTIFPRISQNRNKSLADLINA